MTTSVPAPKSLAAAIFIFNHKFERNVSKLDTLYDGRFDHRQFLMPFADTVDPRVLGVSESSWQFSGHVGQAGARLDRDPAITHYAFISDDLVLNPALNQDNIVECLKLTPRAGYIKSLSTADSLRYRWAWAGEAAMSIRKFGRGFDWRRELPSAQDAQRRFEDLGLSFPFPAPRRASDLRYTFWHMPRTSPWAFVMGMGVTGRRAEYPILCGYADFFVVPAAALDRFVRYCAVFAAMQVFAEVAIPTALALAVDEIVTELPVGDFFMTPGRSRPGMLRGREFWKPGDAERYAESRGYEMTRLNNEFDPACLYVHPVKLSRWH